MTAQQVDEETPLLPQEQPKRTPLPWAQFSILLVLQLAEPLTNQVIYPFAPELIRSVGITHGDETRVGYYVGLMQSLFFATQAMTVLHWSRISDHIGRKPVIMTGLVGLSMSMYCFGLSKTFWGLVLSRCLNGALNGNIGVMKSMVAEITDSTNLAEAYSFMPIAWSTGGTLGPIIGGTLSRPAERFPTLFGDSDFLKEYPYFLPCAVPATFSIIAWLVSARYLHETVAKRRSVRELIFGERDARPTLKRVSSDEASIATVVAPDAKDQPFPLKALMNRRVLTAGGNYACLALIDIAFRAVQPTFYSTPIHLGGLGITPPKIGTILACYGILNGILQIFLFARVQARFGSKLVYLAGIGSMLLSVALFPFISAIAKAEGYSLLLWSVVGLQAALSIIINFAYGAIFMYITASSPNKASLGTVNGMAQMSVSIMRAVGPAVANSLFSLSIDEQHHYLGGQLVYWVLAALVCLSLGAGFMLPKKLWNSEKSS